jgi:hypothetical protein
MDLPLHSTEAIPILIGMVDQPIPGVGGVAGEPSRRQGGYRGRKRKPEQGQDADAKPPSLLQPGLVPPEAAPSQDDPTASLVEVLDRLRATEGPLPVETELARHLRGARYYQEESRHGLPVIDEAATPPPEAADGPG